MNNRGMINRNLEHLTRVRRTLSAAEDDYLMEVLVGYLAVIVPERDWHAAIDSWLEVRVKVPAPLEVL